MTLVIALVTVLLIAGLAGLFMTSARLIRRDINDRFAKVRVRIDHDATAIVRGLLDEHRDGI